MKTVAFFYDKTKPHIDIKVLKSILEYRGISNLVKKDKDCCFIVHLDEDTHPELIQTVKDDFKLAKQYFYEEKYGNIIERMVKVPLNKPHPVVNSETNDLNSVIKATRNRITNTAVDFWLKTSLELDNVAMNYIHVKIHGNMSSDEFFEKENKLANFFKLLGYKKTATNYNYFKGYGLVTYITPYPVSKELELFINTDNFFYRTNKVTVETDFNIFDNS